MEPCCAEFTGPKIVNGEVVLCNKAKSYHGEWHKSDYSVVRGSSPDQWKIIAVWQDLVSSLIGITWPASWKGSFVGAEQEEDAMNYFWECYEEALKRDTKTINSNTKVIIRSVFANWNASEKKMLKNITISGTKKEKIICFGCLRVCEESSHAPYICHHQYCDSCEKDYRCLICDQPLVGQKSLRE